MISWHCLPAIFALYGDGGGVAKVARHAEKLSHGWGLIETSLNLPSRGGSAVLQQATQRRAVDSSTICQLTYIA